MKRSAVRRASRGGPETTLAQIRQLSIIGATAFLLLSCGGDGTKNTVTPTSSQPAATASPSISLGPDAPQIERMREHIERLSVAIGPRLAGSPEEQLAVDYLAAELESYGYAVEEQSFQARPGPRAGLLRYVTLNVDGGPEIRAVSLLGTPSGIFTGPLIDGGDGSAPPDDAAGTIVLFQRGTVTFKDMAANAEAAGALGVVIANKEPGLFPGILDPAVDLPVAGIDQSDGESLRALMDDGPASVTLNVRPSVTSRNVVARPPGGECRTLSGAHYDSVPWAPGANDNASGASIVLELARAVAANGLGGHCFILFGAEELGLVGSRFFVSKLAEAERDALEAVYNFDVTASEPDVGLVGTRELIDDALDLAPGLSVDAQAARLPMGADSDHSSFILEGIPALMLTTPDFEYIHTPRDTIETIVDEALVDIADLGFALIETG